MAEVVLTPAQQVAFDTLLPVLKRESKQHVAVLEGFAGTGKLQPLDEPVLTPSGWVRMGDIHPGDQVIAGDGTPATVLQTFPGHSLSIYRVTFSDGSWTECCEDHLWKVQTKKQSKLGSWSVLSLKALLPGINEGSRLSIGGNNTGFKYRIPLCAPVQFSEKALPVDPYLLGYILGDGHSSKTQNCLRITTWIPDLDSLLLKVGKSNIWKIKQYGSVFHVEVNGSVISAYNSLGLHGLKSKDKYIPADYLCASVSQRKALLAGLMDSDGSAAVRGKASFSTTSPQLADGVVDLVRSLGGLSHIKWYRRACKKDPSLSYDEAHVTVRLPFNPFSLPRKADRYRGHLSRFHFKKQIVSADYVGLKDGQCLLIDHPDHLYLTRHYTVTHNSFLVAQLLAAVAPDQAVAVAAPTNKAVRVVKSMLEDAGVPISGAGEDDEFQRGRVRVKPGRGCTLKSIHSFLGLQMKELDNGKQEAHKARDSNISDYQVLIVDEASMLSNDLFGRIMLERGECRVLFVGDPAQLPPINGRGALSPVFDRVSLKVRLSEVVRQAADNPIIKLSMQIRALIEADVKADPLTLLQVLPAVESGPKAALLAGTPDDLVTFFLDERAANPDSDVRIITYTNARVLDYNRRIHRALHGDTGGLVFVPGEPVIVHTQGKALMDHGSEVFSEERLITSEELVVLGVEIAAHPFYPEIHANRLRLQNALGQVFVGYVPVYQGQLDQQVDALFREWRALKMRAEVASGDDQAVLKEKAADASGKGWALRRAFLNLRHAYALSAHKSQGSSFDCALVDFSDLNKMPDAFEFNRALYVAVTRSREFLALVVT